MQRELVQAARPVSAGEVEALRARLARIHKKRTAWLAAAWAASALVLLAALADAYLRHAPRALDDASRYDLV